MACAFERRRSSADPLVLQHPRFGKTSDCLDIGGTLKSRKRNPKEQALLGINQESFIRINKSKNLPPSHVVVKTLSLRAKILIGERPNDLTVFVGIEPELATEIPENEGTHCQEEHSDETPRQHGKKGSFAEERR